MAVVVDVDRKHQLLAPISPCPGVDGQSRSPETPRRNPRSPGISCGGRYWHRTLDLCRVKADHGVSLPGVRPEAALSRAFALRSTSPFRTVSRRPVSEMCRIAGHDRLPESFRATARNSHVAGRRVRTRDETPVAYPWARAQGSDRASNGRSPDYGTPNNSARRSRDSLTVTVGPSSSPSTTNWSDRIEVAVPVFLRYGNAVSRAGLRRAAVRPSSSSHDDPALSPDR